ncbi:MAG: hypothetical protein AAF485_08875, partial [Chloroflexota bacterium]
GEWKESADVLKKLFDKGGFPKDDPAFHASISRSGGGRQQICSDPELATRRELVKSLVRSDQCTQAVTEFDPNRAFAAPQAGELPTFFPPPKAC